MENSTALRPVSPSISLLNRGTVQGRRQQRLLTAYVALVVLGAVVILAQSAPAMLVGRPEDILMLAGISLAAPSILRPLSLPGGRYSPIALSLSVTGILLFGAETATWLTVLASAAAVLTTGPRQPLRVAFAIASYVISAFVGGMAFERAGGISANVINWPLQAVLGIVVAIACLGALRTLASLCSWSRRGAEESPTAGLRRLPGYLAMGGVGLGLSLVYQAVGPVGLLVFLIPSAVAGQSFWRYSTKAEELRAKNAALEQRLGELGAINQISSHFASMQTLEHTVQLAAVAATKLAGFRIAFVLLYDAAEEVYKPGTVSGVDAQLFAQVTGQLCEEFAPAAAMMEGPIVITAEGYPLYVKALASLGLEISTLTLVAIKHSDELVGVLGVGDTEVPTEDRMRFLGILASQTGLAIDNASLYHRMKQLAISDYMTGLHNHRFFQESLEAEVASCGTTGRPLALMMLDIDHFKDFNDCYGHLAGDELLRQVSVRIKTALRRGDIVCRYGGDEFSVILPGSVPDQAILVGERVRQAVGATPFVWQDAAGDSKEANLSVSIGIAPLTADCRTKQDLVGRADRALYRAKEAGRNALFIYGLASKPTDTED